MQWSVDILTEQGREMVTLALASPALMLEFTDNVEGSITSPTLFQNYCMPFMQETADRIHTQGRYLGSHMDGNLKPLLDLVPECGLDVVESAAVDDLGQPFVSGFQLHGLQLQTQLGQFEPGSGKSRKAFNPGLGKGAGELQIGLYPAPQLGEIGDQRGKGSQVLEIGLERSL